MTLSKLFIRLSMAAVLGFVLLNLKTRQSSSDQSIESNIIAAHKISAEQEYSYSMPRLAAKTKAPSHKARVQRVLKKFSSQKKLAKVFTKKWKKNDFVKKDKKKTKGKATTNKKTDKKDETQVADNSKSQENKSDFQEDKGFENSAQDQQDTPATTVAQNPETNDEEKISFEEWKTLLLSQGSRKNTSLLIEHYSQEKVSENDFYQLISLMMENHDDSIRRQGLNAVNAISHKRSFATLVKYYHLESTNGTLRNDMRIYLDQYASLSRANHLQQALNHSDENVVLEAVELLNKAVVDYQAADSDISSRDRQTLTSILATLTQMQSTDIYITQAIESALNNIEQLISPQEEIV